MKIKSFMGRRLLLGLTIEEVADKGSFIINTIKVIERYEWDIQRLNELYDDLELKEKDKDQNKI
jgi:hypothetical protein